MNEFSAAPDAVQFVQAHGQDTLWLAAECFADAMWRKVTAPLPSHVD